MGLQLLCRLTETVMGAGLPGEDLLAGCVAARSESCVLLQPCQIPGEKNARQQLKQASSLESCSCQMLQCTVTPQQSSIPQRPERLSLLVEYIASFAGRS